MNYHLMADQRFIDDFIDTAERAAPGQNRYLIDCQGPKPQKVHHLLAEVAPVGSAAFRLAMRQIRPANDRFFVHWLSYEACGVILGLPQNLQVGAFFWGGDFIEGPISYHREHLFDPLTQAYAERYEVKPHPSHHKALRKKVGSVGNRLIFPLKEQARLRLKRKAIARLDYFCHFNRHDFEFVRRHFDTKAVFMPFFYGAGYDALPDKPVTELPDGKARLLLGNSASSTNNHLDAFALLEKIPWRENLEVVCPLSYGNLRYAEHVTQKGRAILGESLNPLRELLPLPQYFEMLQKLDGAIMFHNRGQGAGNINVLLLMGKKIFLKPENPLSPMYRELGVQFFAPDEIASWSLETLLRPLPEAVQASNKAAVLSFFNPENKITFVQKILAP